MLRATTTLGVAYYLSRSGQLVTYSAVRHRPLLFCAGLAKRSTGTAGEGLPKATSMCQVPLAEMAAHIG